MGQKDDEIRELNGRLAQRDSAIRHLEARISSGSRANRDQAGEIQRLRAQIVTLRGELIEAKLGNDELLQRTEAAEEQRDEANQQLLAARTSADAWKAQAGEYAHAILQLNRHPEVILASREASAKVCGEHGLEVVY